MNRGKIVFGAFDGISCGQLALERAGVKVDKYYASEIDKYAIQITQKNYPNTIQLGDITQWHKWDIDWSSIDLVLGGSPCQSFSVAGNGDGFNGKSGLFFEFADIVHNVILHNPKALFLLENVVMKKEWQDIISKIMGVKPIEIDSALVSAQRRKRLYWTNIPNIEQPKDKGILLRNILEDLPFREIPKCMYSNYGNRARIKGLNYVKNDKSNTLTTNSTHTTQYLLNSEKSLCRLLSVIECERLQTVPDNEIICIFALCLDQVKNYVNAVEQNPKLLKLVLSAEKEELNEFVKLANQNTKQNNQLTKCIVQQGVDMMTQRQINQCTKINQKENNTTVNNAENTAMCKSQNQEEDSVLPNAFINITEGRIMHFGTEELHRNDSHSTNYPNGKKPLVLFGSEIMELVKDVDAGMKRNSDIIFTSTTLSALSMSSLEQMLATYYLFAKNAITGYIPNTTNQKSLSVQFQINDGYTINVSNTQRYKMLGNGWTVDVIAHIFSFLNK